MNESVFAVNFLETGGIGLSESCEKVGYSMSSADLASPALHRLHFVIFAFVIFAFCEAALRRLLASRATGGYSFASGDRSTTGCLSSS